jgi:hypothetical protein
VIIVQYFVWQIIYIGPSMFDKKKKVWYAFEWVMIS